jgi:hypothetical protein
MLDTVEAPPKKKLGRAAEIPLLIKMKARNLYLIDNLGWDEIGERCGWPSGSLAQAAHREGWPAEKKRRKALLIEKSNAHVTATANEVIEAIASKSEEAALKAMENVDKSLDRSDEFAAKDFQAYTAGVKNLASTARMLREPLGGSVHQDQRPNLNLFFMAQVPISHEPKTAQVVEVKTVTEQRT